MPFQDWQFFKANAAQIALVDTSAPLVELGSLRLTGAPGITGAVHGRYGDSAQRGFLTGSTESLVQPLAGTAGVDVFGLYALATEADLTGSTGEWVGCGVRPGSPWVLTIVRGLTGMSGFSVVASASLAGADYGDTHALLLRWAWYAGSGLVVQAWHGSAEDFSDVQVLATWQDALAPPPAVSTGEGPLAYLSPTGSAQWDQTETLSLPA